MEPYASDIRFSYKHGSLAIVLTRTVCVLQLRARPRHFYLTALPNPISSFEPDKRLYR